MTCSYDDDSEEESESIALTIKDGVASLYKEPFCSIDCQTEQDYKEMQKILQINKNLNERIDELQKTLASNGDTDYQLEYEALHKIAERKLPDDYERLHNNG